MPHDLHDALGLSLLPVRRFEHLPFDVVHGLAKRNVISADALPFVPVRQAAHQAMKQPRAIP
jgi:hypothetical protein